ncbi:MAG: hypothetical protein OHK0022_26340 [Roseiflexaceae bacterium]
MNQQTRLIRALKEALTAAKQLQAPGQTAHQQFTQELLTKIAALLPDMLSAPVLTYTSAIEYFIDHHPADMRTVKGVILRQPHPDGYVVTQVFLTQDHRLILKPNGRPHGRCLLVSRLDEQLMVSFDNADCIIVE